MPLKFARSMVMNWQKDRYSPCKNGQAKPMIKAAKVGITNTGQYFLMDFSTVFLPRWIG